MRGDAALATLSGELPSMGVAASSVGERRSRSRSPVRPSSARPVPRALIGLDCCGWLQLCWPLLDRRLGAGLGW
jgi:hypothetical protein